MSAAAAAAAGGEGAPLPPRAPSRPSSPVSAAVELLAAFNNRATRGAVRIHDDRDEDEDDDEDDGGEEEAAAAANADDEDRGSSADGAGAAPELRHLSASELRLVANRLDISLAALVDKARSGGRQRERERQRPTAARPTLSPSAVAQALAEPLGGGGGGGGDADCCDSHQAAPGRRAAPALARPVSPSASLRRAASADALHAAGAGASAWGRAAHQASSSAAASAGGSPSVPPHSQATSSTADHEALCLSPAHSSGGRSKRASRLSDTSAGAAPGNAASGKTGKARRMVSFAPPSELNRVTAYEVDNSLYISIEYSRPVIGWVILFAAAMLSAVESVVGSYRNAIGVNPYVAATWNATGQLLVSVFVLVAYFGFYSPTRREVKFLSSREGAMLMLVTGCIHAFIDVAHQATVHLTGEWRLFALTSVHPLIITIFGKVFKNTVFLNEVIGTVGLLCGYALAMVPNDIKASYFGFVSLLALSQGIYTASFLFLCTKLRAKVPIPIIFGALALISSIIQFIIVAASTATIHFSDSGPRAVFGFTSDTHRVPWFISSFSSGVALLCFLLTLRFIPPVTVSAVMVIVPLISEIASFLLFYNPPTAVWPVDDATPAPTSLPWVSSATTAAAADYNRHHTSPDASQWGGLPTMTPTHPQEPSQRSIYTIYFSIGAPLCALAAGYIVYVSSIKRAKVDMLVRSLRRRRRPKNPYSPRISYDDDEGAGEQQHLLLGSSAERERNLLGRQRVRIAGQMALRRLSDGSSGGGDGHVGPERAVPGGDCCSDPGHDDDPCAGHCGWASGGARSSAINGSMDSEVGRHRACGGAVDAPFDFGYGAPQPTAPVRRRYGSAPLSPTRLGIDRGSLDAYYDEM